MTKKKKYEGKPLDAHIPDWIGPVESITEPVHLSAERMKVVLHFFYLGRLISQKKMSANNAPWLKDCYFTMSSKILRLVGSEAYPIYIKALEGAGVIERRLNTAGRKSYIQGSRSQLFRFICDGRVDVNPNFRIETVSDYACVKSAQNARNRTNLKGYNAKDSMELTSTHKVMREYVMGTKIDLIIAAEIIKNSRNTEKDKSDLAYFSALNEGEITWFKVDLFGERCHTPFTNLESKYRKAIRFEGYESQPLVNIDIKNSQPYFSAAIGAGVLLDKVLPEFAVLKPLVAELRDKPDYKLYSELCISGRIYEHLGKKMGKSREEIKQQFFRAVLFSKLRVYREDRLLMEVFKKAFPSVYQFFAAIKRLTEHDLPALTDIIKEKRAKYHRSNNSYKILSSCMQRIEGRLITQIIASAIIESGAGPFITVHDSYIALPKHQEAIVKIIEDTFRSFQIEPPCLSIEAL